MITSEGHPVQTAARVRGHFPTEQAALKCGSSHLSGDWRVRMRGGDGRLGHVIPPAWRRQRSR